MSLMSITSEQSECWTQTINDASLQIHNEKQNQLEKQEEEARFCLSQIYLKKNIYPCTNVNFFLFVLKCFFLSLHKCQFHV